MTPEDFPQQRMEFFQTKLNLASEAFDALKPHAGIFAARADDYVAHFMEYFLSIKQTKMILDRDRKERLARVKRHWYLVLFQEGFSRDFQYMVWRSGIRHVEINLDQRYVNLAYSMLRQFCHEVIREELPPEMGLAVAGALDKMLDFCVLMATDSFITTTARCDLGVIQGIAHQVRNPVTVIGGSIKRLKKQAAENPGNLRAYDVVLAESERLERMLSDVGVYSQLFVGEVQSQSVALAPLVQGELDSLAARFPARGYRLETDYSPNAGQVTGDPKSLGAMFHYLLENSLEALDPAEPLLRVSSCRPPDTDMVEVAIFNTGAAPPAGELDRVWTPFHSPKPMGTGFGLPIAEMVARRHLGWLSLAIDPGKGVTCLIRLPGA